MSGQILWYLSRGAGTASLVLLTVVVCLGTLLSARRTPHGETTTIVIAVHRWLSLGMAAFLAAHVVTAIVDGYVDISWVAVILPFTSAYETWWVGLGTIAVDLLAAVILTSLLRHRLSERTWRFVHWFAYAMWPFAVLHGFFLGTGDAAWLRDITIVCGLVGVIAAVGRLWVTTADADARHRIDARGWA